MVEKQWTAQLPQSAEMVEVGNRDGLEIIDEFVATGKRVQSVNALIRAGIWRMEMTSFLHPTSCPS